MLSVSVLTESKKPWSEIVDAWNRNDMNSMPAWIRTYQDVWKYVSRQCNASSHPDKTHPELRLSPPGSEEIDAYKKQQQQQIVIRNGSEAVTGSPETDIQGTRPPLAALVCILDHVLNYQGIAVHAISRLDPHCLDSCKNHNTTGDPSLLHRFHVGSSPVSVIGATEPQVLLAPLLVCAEWHYIGSHTFYSLNTFAFSSLGE